eukprot:1156227-Pelagomonas_calceolata.AAC.7
MQRRGLGHCARKSPAHTQHTACTKGLQLLFHAEEKGWALRMDIHNVQHAQGLQLLFDAEKGLEGVVEKSSKRRCKPGGLVVATRKVAVSIPELAPLLEVNTTDAQSGELCTYHYSG